MLGLRGSGLGAASATVKTMQQALAAYATATGYPLANPGSADGIIGPQTRNAVLAVLPRLPKLPSEVRSLLQYGAFASVVPEVAATIDRLIVQYASEITVAIKLLQVTQTPSTPTGAGTTATTTTPMTTSPAASSGSPAWYKTGTGMAAIGVGATAVLASALLLASK